MADDQRRLSARGKRVGKYEGSHKNECETIRKMKACIDF